jgi:hypothetical protein
LISTQVDSAAESMRQTEKAVSELQHLTGLADELQDPPAILDADLRQVLRRDALTPDRRRGHEERRRSRHAVGSAGAVSTVGQAARRALFLRDDVGVRAARQHV